MMMWPNMMGGFFGGFGIIWMILTFLFFLAIIIGIILLIVWAVRRSSYTQKPHTVAENKPLEILKERYAKGEITKNEYESMKKEVS